MNTKCTDCDSPAKVRGVCLSCYSKRKRAGTLQPRTLSDHGGYGTPEYHAWQQAKQRCLNPKDANYARYGGRGITMHAGWVHDFPAFLAYIGQKPSAKHQLDRIDNDGNYEPGNVRWATPKQNARNRSTTKLTAEQVRQILESSARHVDLAKQFNVSAKLIGNIKAGLRWKQDQLQQDQRSQGTGTY